MKKSARGAVAALLVSTALAAPAAPATAQSSEISGADITGSLDMNQRPWWDPTQVIESAPGEDAHGQLSGLVVRDATTGSNTITAGSRGAYARVQAQGTGFTPGERYTVRITARTAGEGRDWGVYTWQTYRATDAGELKIDLRLYLPSNRAKAGEKIVAAPVVYKAEDVRQDGRPEKANPECVLKCERVAPVAAWTDYSNPDATITFV